MIIKAKKMNDPKSITFTSIVNLFTSIINGFYHKNIHKNGALKNKKNDCGHRNQNNKIHKF
uniref:Uncharacterized protein n=1 Tax=Bacillus pumilus TaxID=1408 RepID=A0A0C5BHT0_BACPU|nr:hypothetical protein 5 [Bacillus pumilus]